MPAARPPRRPATPPRVGLQLYTVRRAAEADLRATLAAVAAMGYEGVELAGLHGHAAAEVRSLLDDAGLFAVGAHVSLEELEREPARVEADAAALGLARVVVPWIGPPAGVREAEAVVARLLAVAARLRRAGLALGYHNHAAELVPLDGGVTFWRLLCAADADLLFLEPDLGWLWYAGCDPAAELARLAGRCPLVHAKDFARPRGSGEDRPIGAGEIAYGPVLAAAAEAGVQWVLAEQDHPAGDGLADAERSALALRRLVAALPS